MEALAVEEKGRSAFWLLLAALGVMPPSIPLGIYTAHLEGVANSS